MNLNGIWKLYYIEDPETTIVSAPKDLSAKNIPCIKANVPGNVELDLAEAGLLPKDLYMGMNILKTEKFETYDWWYETEFTVDAPKNGDSVILSFGAVDCIADYFLNDVKLGSSANMFTEQEFDITNIAKFGESNKLFVNIKSPILATRNEKLEPLELISSWHASAVSQPIRKAPHSYGWDIMPRALSAGIWRDVTVYYKPKYGFNYAYFNFHGFYNGKADVQLIFDTRLPKDDIFAHRKMRVYGSCNGKTVDETKPVYSSCGRFIFSIDTDTLWWPKNYGKQNIWDLCVEVYDRNDKLLFSQNFKQGFRKLELIHSDIVEPGGKFEFRINDVKIMAIGSNWVPMDVFHSRDKARYKKAIEMADDIGCNILRCWGGNVYEDHDFFDMCDQKGIMVWQDFAMACLYYPQTPEFFDKITKEATSVIEKLRNHASLVLWCGDNEIDTMIRFSDCIKPSDNKITRQILPDLVKRLDPKRPYIPSSPYLSDKAIELGDSAYPEDHLWGPRDYYKSDFYTKSKAYFVSETGYHGCPNKESIIRFIDKDKVWPYFNNEQWNLHSTDQRNDDGRTMLMHKQVAQLFGDVPTDIDDYTLASQISQAEAKKFFIERVKAKMDYMGGVIWWNLVDGWPQMSDAVVDYYYNKKLAYKYIKRSSTPVTAFISEMDVWGHKALASNCTNEDAKIEVKVTDAESGKVFFEGSGTVKANSNLELGRFDLMFSAQGMFIIEYKVNGQKHLNTYLYGTPKFDLQKYKSWMEKADRIESKL